MGVDEQNDGEMYDEFGVLKKKYRVKVESAEKGGAPKAAGKAGWEMDDVGKPVGVIAWDGYWHIRLGI